MAAKVLFTILCNRVHSLFVQVTEHNLWLFTCVTSARTSAAQVFSFIPQGITLNLFSLVAPVWLNLATHST